MRTNDPAVIEEALRGALTVIETLDEAIRVTRHELGIERAWLPVEDRAKIVKWRELVD